MRERMALGELCGRGRRKRRILGELRWCLEEEIVFTDAGPRPRSSTSRREHIRYRQWLGVPMGQLLADCIWIEGRNGIGVMWIVRRVQRSRRARENLVRRSRMRIGRRPGGPGHRRAMDHRAIHESSCCEGGRAVEEKDRASWFYSKRRNSALTSTPTKSGPDRLSRGAGDRSHICRGGEALRLKPAIGTGPSQRRQDDTRPTTSPLLIHPPLDIPPTKNAGRHWLNGSAAVHSVCGSLLSALVRWGARNCRESPSTSICPTAVMVRV